MLKWHGLDELRAAMREMPETLAAEARPIVLGAARGAFVEILGKYPVGPARKGHRAGDLRRGLDLKEIAAGRDGVLVRVISQALHADIFENGTAARYTRRKFRASRGSMPPARIFVPTVIEHRYRMYSQLAALLTRHGFEIRGAIGGSASV